MYRQYFKRKFKDKAIHGRSPKRKAQAKGIQPKQAMQWSHHFPVGHEDFSHLLTLIN